MNKFSTQVVYITKDTPIFRDNLTIGYHFINSGNCNIFINNVLLLPGNNWKTFEANMVDLTLYRAKFTSSTSANASCAAANANLTLIIYSNAN